MSQLVLPRLELGEAVLREKARRLTKKEIAAPETQELIAAMFYTLKRTGGVGIAAPQVGNSIQLAVVNIGAGKYRQAPKKRQRFVMINPKIVSASKKQTKLIEGCLSFIDLFGEVSRPSQITVQYYNEKAQLVTRQLQGLVAKVFQHELDHLHGVVWVDKATDTRTFMTRNQYLMRAKQLAEAKNG